MRVFVESSFGNHPRIMMNRLAACLTCLMSLIVSVSIAADDATYAWKAAAGSVADHA